jgi:hypothetical protein
MYVDGICGLLTQAWHCSNIPLVAFFRRTGSLKLFQVVLGECGQVGMSLDEFAKLLVENHTFALLPSQALTYIITEMCEFVERCELPVIVVEHVALGLFEVLPND